MKKEISTEILQMWWDANFYAGNNKNKYYNKNKIWITIINYLKYQVNYLLQNKDVIKKDTFRFGNTCSWLLVEIFNQNKFQGVVNTS